MSAPPRGRDTRERPAGARARRDARDGGAGRRARRGDGSIEWPVVGGWIAAAAAAVVLLAPPGSNAFWGLNGFRGLPLEARLGLVVIALATALLPVLRPRSRVVAIALAVITAVVIAFPLREEAHFLGDTQVRQRAMAVFSVRMVGVTIGEWSTRLHANPLDILVDFLAPIGLLRLGTSIADAVSAVSGLLALVFFAGVWRVSARLGAAPELRLAVCAALALAGTLEVFAGYAESAGLLLATAAWWWAEMLAPLDRRAQALRTAGAWLMLFMAHRLGLIMLLPLAWRALGPPLAGDRPAARRWLLVAGAVAAMVAAATLMLGVGGRQLGMDARDMLPALTGALAAVSAADYLNSLVLVAPLAFVAPWLAGRTALGAFLRSAEGRLLLIAALPLLPLVWIVPAGANALGAHRDWDLGTLAGFTLTLAAVALLVSLPAARLRGALACALPVVTLVAGAWVAVNADPRATVERVRTLMLAPPGLIDPHKSHLHMYAGQRAMDLGEPRYAAPEFDRAFALNPNPRRALMAAEAWARAGDLVAARASFERGKAGQLTPSMEQAARTIEAFIRRAEQDAAAEGVARRAASPADTTQDAK